MKIGVTSEGKDLDAKVDPRFGRCNYFLIIDDDTMNFELISNESAMMSGGAGIKAAQTLAKAGVKVVITGNVGPNAFRTLSASGIKIFTGNFNNIKEAVDKYKKGELDESKDSSVNSHFGIGGNGRGLGRGRGL
jgi:predicted Fe-Mo cluster-binding NifX family protein